MKKEKLGALVFWASLLVLAVCAILVAGRTTLIPTGIPGDAVAFGMGAEEVTQAAGPPDGTRSENGWGTGFFLFHYQREVLGCPAAVSYTFHGRQESKNARVAKAYVDMEFATQAECDRMLEALCAHFRELMEGEPRFDEYGSGSFISGEVSEMMLGVGVRLRVYGVIGTCIGMFDDGHRIV